MALEIPLFPLRTALFPGMPLPLRVFEERYQVMSRELLSSGGIFGVVLIKQGQETGGGAIPFDIGTTARIESHDELEGGQFVLTCRGAERFRHLRMLPPKPYPNGEVEIVSDLEPAPSETLTAAMDEAKAIFPEYFDLALALSDQWARPFQLPMHPHALVNALGPWLRADEVEKQQLLETIEPLERVKSLVGLLIQLRDKVTKEAGDRRRRRYGGLGAQN